MSAPEQPEYSVGIDLGTTNCVVACIDLKREKGPWRKIVSLPLRQRTDMEAEGAPDSFPSFLYRPTSQELAGLSEFPHDSGGWVLGNAALKMGCRTQGRLVNSAKSWLCHSRTDRRAKVLPWGAAEDVPKMSPVEATRKILEHLRFCWEQSEQGKDSPLSEQLLTVTLPASFDQQARHLTIEALKAAGMENAKLLEEPQAAFYNWVSLKKGRWGDSLAKSRRVLICDIGGGTSDFSVIDCLPDGAEMSFERKAVGKHLLLGGDNMDLALAHLAESRISGGSKKLGHSQWQLLSQLAKRAKEEILGDDSLQEVTLRLPGQGTKVIGGLRQAVLSRQDVEDTLLEGFFPLIDDNYQARGDSGALSELGLPYEREPAVTWHIENFLRTHGFTGAEAPDAVLFNGGALMPDSIRERILDSFERCQGKRPAVLESDSLASAVARGAAFAGFTRNEGGLRIGGGSAKTCYIALQTGEGEKHLCVLPKGSVPHEVSKCEPEGLHVRANHPASFTLYESDRFPLDEAGALRKLEEEKPEGRLHSMIRFGKQGDAKFIPVGISATLSELDTVELRLKSVHTPHDWRLEFDLRENAGTAEEPSPQESVASLKAEELPELIEASLKSRPAKSVIKSIERQFELRRDQLALPELRVLADCLLDRMPDNQSHPECISAWMNAMGFALRPGFGHPADPARLNKIWASYRLGPPSGRDTRVCSEWAVLFRRMAPGLESGRQNDLYQRYKKQLFAKGEPVLKGEKLEYWRMFAAFEHLPAEDKKRLGNHLLEVLENEKKPPEDFIFWALALLGTRIPFQGNTENILPANEAEEWVLRLLKTRDRMGVKGGHCLVEIARLSGDRLLDLPGETISSVIDCLSGLEMPEGEDWKSPLEKPVPRKAPESAAFLGDNLPQGLALR